MFEIFDGFNFLSLLDTCVVAVLVYHLLLFLKGTRTLQMITGVLIVTGIFLLSNFFDLLTVKWILSKFFSSFLIIMVILFQDDLRRVLSRMGKGSLLSVPEHVASSRQVLDEIVRTCSVLSSRKIGALIVIERNIILNRYIDLALVVDAKVTMELLISIFNKESPIHDGAVIIQQGRLIAAGCFLPLTRDERVDPNFGTRHRAAIGISQETDAVVVVVSEERGSITVIADGKISKNLEAKELRRALRILVYDDITDKEPVLNNGNVLGSIVGIFKNLKTKKQ